MVYISLSSFLCVDVADLKKLQFHVDTFFRNLELAALGDLDLRLGLVARELLDVLNLVDDVHALENLAENDVAAIEPAVDMLEWSCED